MHIRIGSIIFRLFQRREAEDIGKNAIDNRQINQHSKNPGKASIIKHLIINKSEGVVKQKNPINVIKIRQSLSVIPADDHLTNKLESLMPVILVILFICLDAN